MSIKKQLKFQERLKSRLKMVIKPNEKNRLIREPQDWEIIEKYLRELLMELVDTKYIVEIGWRKRKYIRVYCESDDMQVPKINDKRIKLSNGSNLKITYEDMRRFCIEHHLKLKFTLNKKYNFEMTNKYVKNYTFAYLIGI